MKMKGGDNMKNFEDFLDYIKSDPDNNIYEKNAQMFESEIEALKSDGNIPSEAVLIGAITVTLKSYSNDLLRRYHAWLHLEED
jgi:hypothetical protein